ncbi:DUF4145 domain-containing protein [Pseudocolwellia agarivorans]|uniref:DUF4145 domain-containing protein n=1 Tax=Pseudocolwellia agarivorans TaxID=1911682 RepID=UPI003F88269A
MNNILTDEEFAALFKETIASDYKNALMFMNVDPDISLMKFRKILESLCLQYKEYYNYEFENDNLYEQIEELGHNEIISGVIRESFHEVRTLTNTGVHIRADESNTYTGEASVDELIQSAIDSRKGILNLLEHAFLGLGIDKKLPRYELKVAGGQEQKNLWFRTLSSSESNDYYLLGELYRELAQCYENLESEDDSYTTRANSMFSFALENFRIAFKFAAKMDIYSVVRCQGQGISISPGSYQSLFQYSLLCLKGKGDKHGITEAKVILRALIKRGYNAAYAYLGWAYYRDKDYRNAYKYLSHRKVVQDVFTFHKLGVLYSEGEACSINMNKAIDYYSKAAELDDADSMFQLGKLYRSARGEWQSDELAKMYLYKAVSMGHLDAAIYLDDHFFKIREKLLGDMDEALNLLTKESQQQKKTPIRTVAKESRNALCSCGSGVKYKLCCGA